jgi:signal transduction histidine kinase
MKDSKNTNLLDAFENAFPDTGFVLDEAGTVIRTFAGPEIDVLLVDDFRNAVGKTVEEVFREQTAATLQRQIDQTLKTESLQTSTFIIETEVGAHSFEARMAPVQNGETHPMVIALFRDITARDLYAQYLDEKNRIIQTIQESTQAVSRAETVPDLYDSICRVITASAPYQFAWIGRYDEASGRVVPESVASGGQDHIARLDLAVTGIDPEAEHPPAVEAARNEEPCVVQTIYSPTKKGSWRKYALEQGFDSVAAFPIFDHETGTLDGVLTVYAQRPYAFDFSERKLFEELCRDIALTKRALRGRETIAKQKQALESRNTEWEVLNRIIRHDIRNKMVLVQGFAELLTDSVDGEDRDNLEKILESSQEVVEITKEAHVVAEALANNNEISLQSFDLRASLETELNQVRRIYSDATVTVDGEIPDVTVRANEFLSSVFRNVLANAVVHNDSATPTVVVSTSTTADTVTVKVADNGPGLPAAIRETVAGPSEDGLKDSAGKEHGIGLRLVSSLVDQYDGALEVTDNDPTGTVVSIQLNRQ